MTDIVARLRSLVIYDEVMSDNPLGRDAADEIERLRAEVERYRTALRSITEVASGDARDIARAALGDK